MESKVKYWVLGACLAFVAISYIAANLAGMQLKTYNGSDGQYGVYLMHNGTQAAGCELIGHIGCWTGDAS